ncbi:MAG: DNA repair protein RecN [Candidatus Sumerlaeaceae bacterium]|nr:DNA repair protein RecN [Candidatus Sumerlaeaceae bacterium]
MLKELHISGFAIIEQLGIEFDRGMTTITGETGAGKSLLLGALRLLLGERASSDLVAGGRAKARVQAVFSLESDAVREQLQRFGLLEKSEESLVIIRREVLANGGSRHFVNDVAVTLSLLEELGRSLVALHGQNDQAFLLQPARQLELLDAFGRCEKLVQHYKECFLRAREACHSLEKLLADAADLEKRRSFLEFQVQEIDRANLQVGEDQQLEIELGRLRHSQRIFEALQRAVDILYEGERTSITACSILGDVETALRDTVRFDPTLEELARSATELRISAESLGSELRSYLGGLELAPERLSALEDRAELIRALTRKYGRTVNEILKKRDELAQELSQLENYEVSVEAAHIRYSEALERLECAARELTTARIAAAKRFEKLVMREMHHLNLPDAQFMVTISPRLAAGEDITPTLLGDNFADELRPSSQSQNAAESFAPHFPRRFGARGADEVEFMVVLNPGDEPRPLRKVASGGELSRIMLAIECVLAHSDNIPTLVFDEIDAGISGQAAERVAEKLRQLAAEHQVLCVTHLPQIAACGHRQLVVEKIIKEGRTSVWVRDVAGEERELALANMLSSDKINVESRQLARRLLERFGALNEPKPENV